jgi:hypothetical protein
VLGAGCWCWLLGDYHWTNEVPVGLTADRDRIVLGVWSGTT